MKVSFLFGNGFDIQCGFKTGYVNFYEEVLKNKYGIDIKLSNVKEEELAEKISKIDNVIYKEIAKNKDEIYTWADLELQLGLLTYRIKSEDADKFLEDFIELNIDLSDYLKGEQLDDNTIIDDTSKLVEKTLNSFYTELRPEEKKKVKELFSKAGTININLITFNYTNSLSLILENCKSKAFKNKYNSNYNIVLSKEVIHAHGQIGNMATLGVNDDSQFNSELFNNEEAMYLIKPKSLDLNREVFKLNALNALKDSSIINVFGMSIGKTDKYWWNRIAEILLENSERVLIIHEFSDLPNSNSSLHVHRKRRIVENRFLENLEIDNKQKEKLRNQLLICYKSKNMLNINLKNDINNQLENENHLENTSYKLKMIHS